MNIDFGSEIFADDHMSLIDRYSNPDAVDCFLVQASRDARALAVVNDGHRVSYGELEDRARALAGIFMARTAPRVLIALPSGADAYAAMLGASLAGGFYTPLNVNAPALKWAHVCRLLQPDFIVGPAAIVQPLLEQAPGACGVDVAAALDGPRLRGRGTRHETAYVIFTSGSTGTPKGVVVARSGLDHYVGWVGRSLEITAADRVSQYANIAFDLSVLEIYGALCHGASLHPVGGLGDRMMPARMVERERLTVWVSVPSVISLMMQAGELTPAHVGSLRRLVFCGEPLLAHQVDAVFRACPRAMVQNTYGPTEATVSMTSLVLTADSPIDRDAPSIAIGDPIEGMELLLVGDESADEGELVIVGPQLALGYWQDAERTEHAFRTIVRDGRPCRAYHTGDRAERRADGRIHFRERIDFQVKVRGFRVELGEVAAALMAIGFANVCVFKHDREERLVAVVETASPALFDERAVHRALLARIDSYAVPQEIRATDRLPRNDNDKIDRELTRAWFRAAGGGR